MTSKVPLIIHNSDAVGQLSETEPFISFSFFFPAGHMAKKKSNAAAAAVSQRQQQQQDTGKVGQLPKLVVKRDLSVTELEPNQIYLIHNFFTSKECESLIHHFNACLSLRPVPAIPKPGEAFRSNDRESVQDTAIAQRIWDLGIKKACLETPGISEASLPRKPVGLNSNIRIYRYREGQVRYGRVCVF